MELEVKDGLPVWLNTDDAKKLVPHSKLVTLKGTGVFREANCNGKHVYNLEDILAHLGIKNLIVMGSHELGKVAAVEEKPVSVVPTKDVVGFKVEKKGVVTEVTESNEETRKPYGYHTFLYTKLFTKKYDKFPDMLVPSFNTKEAKKDVVSASQIQGKLVSLQLYRAKLRDGMPITKCQFVLELGDNRFHIVQIPLYYEETIFVEMIMNCLNDEKSDPVENDLVLKCYNAVDSNAYRVECGEVSYDWEKPEGYIPKTPITVLVEQWSHLQMKMEGKGKVIHKVTADKEFFEYIQTYNV